MIVCSFILFYILLTTEHVSAAGTERPYFAELGMTTGYAFQHRFAVEGAIPDSYWISGMGFNLQTSVGAYLSSSFGLSAEIKLPAFFYSSALPFNHFGIFTRWKLSEHWVLRAGPFYSPSTATFYVANAWSVRAGMQYVSSSDSFFYVSGAIDYEYLKAPDKAVSPTSGLTQALESSGIILMISLGMRTSLKP